MKKNYFYSLFAALMLFVAMPATAQNFAISDLFGKWKFEADIAWADDATEEQKAQLSGYCDVTIKESASVMAEIWGFAGSKVQQNVNRIGNKEGQDMLRVDDPNSSVYPAYLWDNLFIANLNGDNPYGYFNDATLEWEVEQLGYFYYNVDAVNGLITVPDFTIVQIDDKRTCKQGKLVATFTNVKMTLVEAEAPKAVENVSGDYVFKAVTGQWMTMEGSQIPTEFAVSLVNKSDDNRTYEATVAIEGYDAVTLPATYDGALLSLAFSYSYIKSDYAVIENSIRFAEYYQPANKEGKIQFKGNENGFSLSGGLAFVSDSIGRNKADTADSTYVVNRQYYADGSLKIAEETIDFNWAGVYTVNSKSVTLIDKENKDEWASEFQMEIAVTPVFNGVEVVDGYAIKSFLGYDLSFCGGWVITPAADGKSATVALNGYYSMAPLQNLGGGEYLVMTNAKGQNTQLTLTVNEDGTLSIENFAVAKHAYNTEDFASIVVYKDVTAEPYVAPAFNWAGTYAVTVASSEDVTIEDENYGEWNSEFQMVIGTASVWNGVEVVEGYAIKSFMGNDLTFCGGWVITPAEDGKSATVALNAYYSMAPIKNLGNGDYLTLTTYTNEPTEIVFTLNDNGMLSVSDFAVCHYNYTVPGVYTPVASYKNVTLKKVLGAPVLVAPVAEEGKDINSLMYFSFNFGEKVAVNADVLATMALKKDGEVVAAIDSYYDAFDNGVVNFYILNFVSVKTPGTYTLELPAGLVTAADGKEFIGAKYEFTVVAPAPSYSINPNGGKVNSIEKITIKCENVSEVVVDDTKKARLVCGLVAYDGVVAKVENNIEITFDKIEDEGEYTLTIAEGLFTMKGLDGSEVASEEIEVTFTVEAAAAVTPLEIEKVELLDGGLISIVYNQPVYFGNADWMAYAVYLTAENGDQIAMWQYNPYDNEGKPIFSNNTVVFVPVEIGEEGWPIYDNFGNPNIVAIPAGKYTLDVADVTVYYGAEQYTDEYGWPATNWNAFGSCDGTYTITIEEAETAIEGVEAEAENAVIYDLTGRRVNEITKAGIYIINGKKIMVK